MNAISSTVEETSCTSRQKCATDELSPDVLQATQADPGCGVPENSPENQKSGRGGLRSPAGGRPIGRKNKPRQPRLIGVRWHVFQMAHAQRNRVVQDLIEGENRFGYVQRPPFRIEVPTVAKDVLRRGVVSTVSVPMFQGYGFVEFDRAEHEWKSLLTCDGVIRLFSTRTLVPIPLPVGFVEKLINTRADRLTVPLIPNDVRSLGDDLVITDGPLTSFPAVCEECDGFVTKASALIFGKRVPVTLPWTSFRSV